MKAITLLLLILGSILSYTSFSQAFTNGELDGPTGIPAIPPSWQDVPDTDPASLALAPIQASVDVVDATGPNLGGGIAAAPFSGTACVSGLQATNGSTSYWHEGIMQTVNGFTPGNSYTICFYQAVVKQQNCLDGSGSWRVYFDNTLIGTSAVSTSALAFDNPNVQWDLRTVTFTATAASHTIKFLPWDDDANQLNSAAEPDGGLRMGIDLVSIGAGGGDPTITPVGPYCASQPSVILTAVDGGGTWTGNGIVNASTGEFDPAVAGVGNHNIVYTLPSGCGGTVSDSITIVVSNSSSALWTNPGPLCEADGPINLDALITGTAGGSWSGTGVTGSTFDPTGLSGNISVTYQVGSPPCDSMMTQDINVISVADPSWNPPTNLCSTSPLFDLNTTITGTNGGTWSGTGVSGNMFDPSVGTQSITYTVGSGSCQQMSAQTITIGTGGDASWTTLTMCISDAPIDLTGQITGDLGGSWSGTGMTGSVFDPFNGSQSITYTVGGAGCQVSSTQTITVVDPQVTINPTHVSCAGLTDGAANAVATGVSGSETYAWNPGGQTTASITGLGAGTYTVTVTDGSCSTTASVTIIEPTAISDSLVAIGGCQAGSGQATVYASGGAGGFTYQWTPSGQTTQTATLLDSAMHTVTITDANGCTQVDSILVQTYSPPIIQTINDTTITYPNCIQLTASGGVSYSWTPADDLDCDDCPSPLACPTYQTTYCVSGTNANGCAGSDCVTISVDINCGDVFVPSAFSPNNDGNNDLECVYSDCFEYFTFTIYNRWGEVVFESSNENICWDGTWKGKELNSAVFVYMLEGQLINGEAVSQKGNISLIR